MCAYRQRCTCWRILAVQPALCLLMYTYTTGSAIFVDVYLKYRQRCTCWSVSEGSAVHVDLLTCTYSTDSALLVDVYLKNRQCCSLWCIPTVQAALYLLMCTSSQRYLQAALCLLMCTYTTDSDALVDKYLQYRQRCTCCCVPAGSAVLVGFLHPHVDVVDVEEGELPGHHRPHHQPHHHQHQLPPHLKLLEHK